MYGHVRTTLSNYVIAFSNISFLVFLISFDMLTILLIVMPIWVIAIRLLTRTAIAFFWNLGFKQSKIGDCFRFWGWIDHYHFHYELSLQDTSLCKCILEALAYTVLCNRPPVESGFQCGQSLLYACSRESASFVLSTSEYGSSDVCNYIGLRLLFL